MGKGSARRPSQVTHEEEQLRWRLYKGEITETEFNAEYKRLQRIGKIKRSGRILRG